MTIVPFPAPFKPRPSWRFMLSHPAHLIALGFGSGLSPIAPGTVGSLWGWLSFILLSPYLSDIAWAGLLSISLVVGWWACTTTARHLQVPDPGCIVWDEIIAMWAILWLVMPASLWGQLAAFAWFRFFDTIKPGPVGWADTAFKSQAGQAIGWRDGWGILFDDLVAALCTLLVLALWRAITL
jgi:phosphatidylglycerophosphatase A